MSNLQYRRILIKLSGEALAGEKKTGIDPNTIKNICTEISEIFQSGIQIALVIGGGNIFRGISSSATGMDRANADYMGMLATVMNAVAVQDALEKLNCPTRVLSAITIKELCEPFIYRRAIRHMEKGRIIICAAGTGNPYFTTDSAAVLRAVELKCDLVIKATKVNGIFNKDPVLYPDAIQYNQISYSKALQLGLRIMDSTAFTLAKENSMPIAVCNMFGGSILKIISGEMTGTLVQGE